MGSWLARPTRALHYDPSLVCKDCNQQGRAGYVEIRKCGTIVCVFCLSKRRELGNYPFCLV